MTELLRRRPEPPHGNGPARLPPLPPGDVLVLRVRRGKPERGVAVLVLETTIAGDAELGAYVEELAAAWDLVGDVATEVRQGKRLLGGTR